MAMSKLIKIILNKNRKQIKINEDGILWFSKLKFPSPAEKICIQEEGKVL